MPAFQKLHGMALDFEGHLVGALIPPFQASLGVNHADLLAVHGTRIDRAGPHINNLKLQIETFDIKK